MLGHLGLGTCAPKGRVQLSGVHGLLGSRYLGALFLLSCGHLPPDLGDVAAFLFGHGDNGPGCGLEISPGDALGTFLARLIGRPDACLSGNGTICQWALSMSSFGLHGLVQPMA
jgi:hypothetical protein